MAAEIPYDQDAVPVAAGGLSDDLPVRTKAIKKSKTSLNPIKSTKKRKTSLDPKSTNKRETSPDPIRSTKKRKTSLDPIEVDLSLPEPPSKRAKRALKKGKPLPAKPQSDDEGEQDVNEKSTASAAKNDSSTKKERSEHGVWIGNLPFRVTKVELRRWLVENSGGVIDDGTITRVHIPTKKQRVKTGEKEEGSANMGFAYVDFSSLEARVAATALSETELGGRRLLIKDKQNFDGRPATTTVANDDDDDGAEDVGPGRKGKSKSKTNGRSSTKIFVGNMGFAITDDDLRAHFEPCGAIRWVKVATFEDTGKCKGYGWVSFEEPKSAASAVRGFVKVKEPVATVEDFMVEGRARPVNEGDHEEDAGHGTAEVTDKVRAMGGDEKPRVAAAAQTTTRKWGVDRLHGRLLKIELAEDDHVRYNKRFGKGASARLDIKKQPQAEGEKAHEKDEGVPDGFVHGKSGRLAKSFGYHEDMAQARLMGAAVEPKGVKTTFD